MAKKISLLNVAQLGDACYDGSTKGYEPLTMSVVHHCGYTEINLNCVILSYNEIINLHDYAFENWECPRGYFKLQRPPAAQRPKQRNCQRNSGQNCARTEDVLAITLRRQFLFWREVWQDSTENKAILEQTLSVFTLRCDQKLRFFQNRANPDVTFIA